MAMRTLPTAVLLALCGVSVQATPAGAEGITVRITEANCSRLVSHQPDADVAYQPGADVHGRPVAPADLGGGDAVALPDTIVIPIEIDLQDRFHIPANSALYDADAQVGLVEVTGDRITFNGQVLGDPETRALAAACQRIERHG